MGRIVHGNVCHLPAQGPAPVFVEIAEKNLIPEYPLRSGARVIQLSLESISTEAATFKANNLLHPMLLQQHSHDQNYGLWNHAPLPVSYDDDDWVSS